MKKFNILIIIIVIFLCYMLTPIVFQNDTFYTIKIGELILNNGIDMLDHFSIHNIAYTYPHWLYDVFIYIIYHFFSFTGIYISTIILFIGLMLSIYYTNTKLNKHKIIIAFITILSILPLTKYATARAQLVSYILFVWEYFFIEKFFQTKSKKYALYLVIISLILCNIHVAVWPFYFILFLPFIAEYLIAKVFKLKTLFKEKIEIEKNNNVKYLLLIILFSLIMGLITPIKDTPYTYLIYTMMGNSQSYIEEHLTLDTVGIIYIITFLLEYIFMIAMSKTKLRYLFLTMGLAIMCYTSNRHVALFVIFFSFVFINSLDNFFIKYNLKIDNLIKIFVNKIVMTVIIVLLLSGSIITFMRNKDKEYFSNDKYPIKAADYIINNLDYKNIRMFNEYNYGSYLVYRGIPVFIDSRADLYTKEFSGLDYDIFDDYIEYGINYNEIIEFYNLNYVLLSKERGLYTVFLYNSNYKMLYEDDNFILFEKIN